MARDASTIQADIDALRARMAKGILRVKHGETETTYAGPSDMQKAIDALLAELNGVSATAIRQVRFTTSKGLD